MQRSRYNVVWLTGLSGAGKSTIAIHLSAALRGCGYSVNVLDGDELRKGLCSDLGFGAADRAENIRRAGHVARLLAEGGNIVLVALITPLQVMREQVRAHLPSLLEVFVDAPLHICEHRDPKGLYKRARAGELGEFTGLTSPFEIPKSPDVICQTHLETVEACTAKILVRLLGVTEDEAAAVGSRRRTIAVDFDGVIADYEGWRGSGSLGSTRPDVLAALRQLRGEGWKIIVHTTRGADEIEQYLLQEGVPYDEINRNSDYVTGGQKPIATVYWDDRALRYSGNAQRDIEVIRSMRTWNGRS